MKKITLNIGDVVVVAVPAVIETVLGSCVSVCLWDEETGIGGMNHYMLPEYLGQTKKPSWCGHESIRRLVDDMLTLGAERTRLRAKVFGGGKVIKEFFHGFEIGQENIRVAKEMLGIYMVPIVREYTGHDCGIKVIFHSSTGRAFVKKLDPSMYGQLGYMEAGIPAGQPYGK